MRLLFAVFEARGLQAIPPGRFADPYVKVRCNGRTHRSRGLRRTLNPKWPDAWFEFDIPCIEETTVTVEVKDDGPKKQRLGICTVLAC